jgi:hypothetical protein
MKMEPDWSGDTTMVNFKELGLLTPTTEDGFIKEPLTRASVTAPPVKRTSSIKALGRVLQLAKGFRRLLVLALFMTLST